MRRRTSFVFWGSASKTWSLDWLCSGAGFPVMCGSVSWSEARYWSESGSRDNCKSISFLYRGGV